MSGSERRKGARFEVEIANYLAAEFGQIVRRKLGQARDSGEDIKVGKFIIECKRRAKIAVYEWLDQCVKATEPGEISVVIARADGKRAIAILDLADLVPLIRGEIIGVKHGSKTDDG